MFGFVSGWSGLGGSLRGRGGVCEGRPGQRVVVVAGIPNLTKKPIPYPGDEEFVEQLVVGLDLESVAVEEKTVKEGKSSSRYEPQVNRDEIKKTREKNYELRSGEIAVRFTNSPMKMDVIAPSEAGKNLMKLGDSVDIKIPRGCRTGLCGACTVDLEDPSFPDGIQTIRACQTNVQLPPGCDEMVIDLHRMERAGDDDFSTKDPFARFEMIDTEYKPAAAPKSRNALVSITSCTTCDGTGKHICPECMGEGTMQGNAEVRCYVCMGRPYVRCADCQGSGMREG
ncbi:hypothetical protein NDN08_002673 [Rhodosorus marinus]|uniref:2Fe-2S ferredoxin-type domain-containing protein n=1 Tax=Rhodosorus marinus TaxID=101924 RepID=A0AAV8UX30_9RHOD|nr:hypothetical protein NDN08_002673 [Rhodosorus marinus]